jgi:RND family efflux transporter MFP subunit
LSLTNWAGDLAASNNSVPVQTLVTKSNTYIASTKKFFADLALIVNKLAPNNSGLSQATINNDIDSINSGLAVLNQAETSLSTAQIDLTTTKSNYSLRQAGNSSETIAGAQAKVDLARAELAKDTILSPLDGVVARIDPQLGEFVTAGKGSFSVISNQAYKIEAFVPEADIAKVKIGDPATTTLDAYGSDTYFASKVTMIDPAQTVLEGVPTYKVTLYFNSADNRIRSGMTANLDIHTNERDGVLNVPYRAIISNDGHKTIRIVNPDGKTYQEVPITTGLRGSDGTIEITSGLKAGQKVVTYLKP